MSDGTDPQTLTPDDAFAALGNETRIEILQTLAESDSRGIARSLLTAVGTEAY